VTQRDQATRDNSALNGQRADANTSQWMGSALISHTGFITTDAGQRGRIVFKTPPLSRSGGTNSWCSEDAMAGVDPNVFLSRGFGPPRGRCHVTRSGTKCFHGTLFRVFGKTCWTTGLVVTLQHLAQPAERQNDFGGCRRAVSRTRSLLILIRGLLVCARPPTQQTCSRRCVTAARSASMQHVLNGVSCRQTALKPDRFGAIQRSFQSSSWTLQNPRRFKCQLEAYLWPYNYSPSRLDKRGSTFSHGLSPEPDEFGFIRQYTLQLAHKTDQPRESATSKG